MASQSSSSLFGVAGFVALGRDIRGSDLGVRSLAGVFSVLLGVPFEGIELPDDAVGARARLPESGAMVLLPRTATGSGGRASWGGKQSGAG